MAAGQLVGGEAAGQPLMGPFIVLLPTLQTMGFPGPGDFYEHDANPSATGAGIDPPGIARQLLLRELGRIKSKEDTT